MKLKKLRNLLKMTQIEIAKKLQSTQANISLWERGKFIPCQSSIDRLNDAFHDELSLYDIKHFTRLDFGDNTSFEKSLNP